MRKDRTGKPPKRFSRSGHTSHAPREFPPAGTLPPGAAPTTAPPPYPPGRGGPAADHATQQIPARGGPPYRANGSPNGTAAYGPPTAYGAPAGYGPAPGPGPGYGPGYEQPGYGPSHQPPAYGPPSAYGQPGYAPAPGYGQQGYASGYAGQPGYPAPPVAEFGQPTYHHIGPPSARMPAAPREPANPAVAITRGAFFGTNRAARFVARKVINASTANGARESGLTALIWNQVLSYGTDAMITVALAGTVFFGASAHAQRGNVLLYLLVTMAPFAVVAPFIGPALDRLQHGRRWTMAGTAIGRAILALIMAGHPTDLFVLYPCALGSLVLSKAYAVVRAAASPRLVPDGMTLTEANARLTIFGLGSTMVLGGLVGAVIKLSGSYTAGLLLTAVGFVACAVFAFRLPPQVDSAHAAGVHPEEPPRPRRQANVAPFARLAAWARHGYHPGLIVALYGESAQRFLSGELTIFMAFYVEATQHGATAALQLGGVVAASGLGSVTGNALGARLKISRPDLILLFSAGIAALACVLTAILFSVLVASIGIFVGAVTNAISKVALDSMIQRDVVETLRSSAFARSETFLQLAWVLGAAIGVILPARHPGDGAIGFWVSGGVVTAVSVLMVLRTRALRSAAKPAAIGFDDLP